MAITLQLPPDLEERLRAEFPDIERRVAEAYAVESFRRGEISSGQVARLLGLDGRPEAVRFLSERGVYPGYDVDDFAQDLKTLDALGGGPR